MIKAVIFDLDNTLIDFLRMKSLSCDAAISAMIDAGLEMEKEKAMKKLYKLYDRHGMEDRVVFQKLLKHEKGDVNYKILASGIVAYRKMRMGFLEPYPYVIKTLIALKQRMIKLAIVTDAPRLKAWLRLCSMKIADFFDVVVAYEDTLHEKPSAIPFEVALSKLKLKPIECVMVGDRPERDIKGAKALGMVTCFAKYGNPKIRASGADYDLKDIRDLLKIAG